MSEPILCYIMDGFAWFTTTKLEDQSGDDWNDDPYDDNAGPPYEWRDWMKGEPYKLYKLAFEGPFDEPKEYQNIDKPAGSYGWSVDDINARKVAWLAPMRFYPDHGVSIWAGTTMTEFIRLVQSVDGGVVYAPIEFWLGTI